MKQKFKIMHQPKEKGKKVRKYFESNENEIHYQILWTVTKVVLEKEIYSIKCLYIKKKVLKSMTELIL